VILGTLLLFSSAQAGGPTIMMSGVVDSAQPGPIRLELLRPQGPGKNPLLVWEGWIEGPGPYSMEVPAGLETVKLRAALDLKRDGIGPDDPQVRIPITLVVGQAKMENIDILIRPPEHGSPALPSSAPPPNAGSSAPKPN
jgi:hypothetical protein